MGFYAAITELNTLLTEYTKLPEERFEYSKIKKNKKIKDEIKKKKINLIIFRILLHIFSLNQVYFTNLII